MGCDCSWCQGNRKHSERRQIDPPDRPIHSGSGKYEKKSAKIWLDRIKARQRNIDLYQKWADDERQQKDGWWRKNALSLRDRAQKDLTKIKEAAAKALNDPEFLK